MKVGNQHPGSLQESITKHTVKVLNNIAEETSVCVHLEINKPTISIEYITWEMVKQREQPMLYHILTKGETFTHTFMSICGNVIFFRQGRTHLYLGS